MEENSNVTGAWVSIQEAASLKGVSQDTIRNWIKSSKIMSRKVEMPQGFRYEVFVVDYQAVEIVPPSSIDLARSEVPPIDLAPMADLIRSLVDRNAQLEREAGSLAEKLQAAESKLQLLEAPPTKPWWKFWD